jgi:hypothetical protein
LLPPEITAVLGQTSVANNVYEQYKSFQHVSTLLSIVQVAGLPSTKQSSAESCVSLPGAAIAGEGAETI